MRLRPISTSWPVLLGYALMLIVQAGCTDDGDNKGSGDATLTDAVGGADGAGADGTGLDGLGTDIVVDPCMRQGFTATLHEAYFDGDTYYFGYSSEAEPFDILSVQLYTESPTPGSFSITAANYSECETCVLVFGDCTGDSCAKTFLAYEGSVSLTEWGTATGEPLTGTLTNVKLVQVEIDGSFVSTPVPGGETWCIDSASFTAPVGGEVPTVACDPAQTAFDLVAQDAERDPGGNYGNSFFYNGYTADAPPRDWLTIESYIEFGGPSAPGTYEIVYDDYFNCSLCVLVSLACDVTNNCTGGDFLAVSGTLDVATLGDVGTNFTATLRDVELFEHTVDENGSMPVAGGRSYCISELALAAPIVAAQ